ncbi:ArsC/Spx/MgsR family protein [Roseomonas sp. BN140053]|uniref:ArsC/Spx/MgsR family protein n=1 Tax=Roseomonas sp. BN140053 TaxID=3391898 RepID=UPI0039EA5C98
MTGISAIGHAQCAVTIFYDPDVSVSRDVIALVRNSGIEPELVEVRQAPPARDRLLDLLRRMDAPPRALLRLDSPLYDSLHLSDPDLPNTALVDAMLSHPELMAGPIVETPLGVRLTVPAETVLNILPDAQIGAFTKEDGQHVIDAQGRRVDREGSD